MIVLSGALVLVALVLLVFGALDRNLPFVYASIGVSVLSLLLLCVGILQRRGELAGEDPDDAPTPVTDTSAERVPALVCADEQDAPADGQTAELVMPAAAPVQAEDERPASRRVVPDAAPEPDAEDLQHDVEPEPVGEDDLHEDEDSADEDEDEGSGVTVLVVSGRPRYHLEGCRVLRGKEPQPLERDDARMHGFTPCGVCKPDADEAAAEQEAPPAGGQSFTEALFGEPLFADPAGDVAEPSSPQPSGVDTEPSGEPAERVPTSALPARPVQPVLTELEPAAEPAVAEAAAVEDDGFDDDAEPPATLLGEDPADDPTLGTDVDLVAEPAPDVDANPDELAATEDSVGAEPVPADDAVDRPAVLEPELHELPPADVPAGEVEVPAAVAAEPVPVAIVDGSEEPAPARRRASSRKAPASRADEPAAGAVAAEPAKAAAKRAPAKKAPAKEAAAKQAPAKRAPAKKAVGAAAEAPPAAPQVKRPLVRTVRADALRLGAPSTGGTTTRVSARGAAPAAGASVVVVPDRDRFHRPECRFVRGATGATTLPKASASRQGYAACGVCKP